MKCPNCNEEIDDNARFCESCGKTLNDESTIYCPKCGELTKSNVSFCSNCGHKFTNENTVSNEAYRSAPFILGLIASIYAFIIIIVLLGILILRWRKKNSSVSKDRIENLTGCELLA